MKLNQGSRCTKDQWIRIHDIVLPANQRAKHLPDDTKQVPLEMWTKGFLLQDAKIGDRVQIKTITGRLIEGILIELYPTYTHDYGDFIPELLEIGLQLKDILWGGGDLD